MASAGGVDAIFARAKQLFSAGEHSVGLQLAKLCVEARPDNQDLINDLLGMEQERKLKADAAQAVTASSVFAFEALLPPKTEPLSISFSNLGTEYCSFAAF